MSFPDVITQGAEDALRSLVRLESQESNAKTTMIVNSVSIVEGYTDAIIDKLIVESTILEHQFGRVLVEANLSSFYGSWENRKTALNKYFGIKIGTMNEWRDINAVVEARNSIVHGGGAITSRQGRTAKSLIELRSKLLNTIECELQAGTLNIGSNSGSLAICISKCFIHALDAKVVKVPGVIR